MDPTIGYIAAALIAATGGWIVAQRRFSGKIESSEATELWAESKAIREWSAVRIDTLEKENEALREGRAKDRERIAVLEDRLKTLEAAT